MPDDIGELWIHALFLLPGVLVIVGVILAAYHVLTVEPLRERILALEREAAHGE